MSSKAAIVGAGISGRLLALELVPRGWDVSLFDRNGDGKNSCSFAAAGMLAPYCELESAEPEISEWGMESLELWPSILSDLGSDVYFQREGSLVVAHPQDYPELERLERRVLGRAPKSAMTRSDRPALLKLEPELDSRFVRGLYFPLEGQIDSRGVIRALGAALEGRVTLRWGAETTLVAPHQIEPDTAQTYDWVVDCRGMGAKNDLKDLRAVRGEMIFVHAPEVNLNRPVRLMHPKYPLYVVPRSDNHYWIGASRIESEDLGPITVRTTLELLSAAYSLHSGFSEARILETVVQCRPAFADNRPLLRYRSGLIHLNGLYRHGFLISPAIVKRCADFLETGKPKGDLFEEIA